MAPPVYAARGLSFLNAGPARAVVFCIELLAQTRSASTF